MREACERIPGAIIPHYGGPPPAPSMQEWQEIRAAGVLFPALTTTVGLQATREFLNEFREHGVEAQREWSRRARESRWGPFSYHQLLKPSPDRIIELETPYLPQELQRDYEHTFGHGTQA